MEKAALQKNIINVCFKSSNTKRRHEAVKALSYLAPEVALQVFIRQCYSPKC